MPIFVEESDNMDVEGASESSSTPRKNAKPVPEAILPELIKLVHGQSGLGKLAVEFHKTYFANIYSEPHSNNYQSSKRVKTPN